MDDIEDIQEDSYIDFLDFLDEEETYLEQLFFDLDFNSNYTYNTYNTYSYYEDDEDQSKLNLF